MLKGGKHQHNNSNTSYVVKSYQSQNDYDKDDYEVTKKRTYDPKTKEQLLSK
jgi:hypothetical protein